MKKRINITQTQSQNLPYIPNSSRNSSTHYLPSILTKLELSLKPKINPLLFISFRKLSPLSLPKSYRKLEKFVQKAEISQVFHMRKWLLVFISIEQNWFLHIDLFWVRRVFREWLEWKAGVVWIFRRCRPGYDIDWRLGVVWATYDEKNIWRGGPNSCWNYYE